MATNNQLNLSLSGQIGTGTFVGGTSASISNPIIQLIVDSSAKNILANSTTASAVNDIIFTNSAAGSSIIMASEGTDSNINLNINTTGTAGVNVKGVSTNTDASAGYVGEIITTNVTSTGISLTTSTPKTLMSISLTAGDWDVDATIAFTPATGTSITNLRGAFSLTDNVLAAFANITGTGFIYNTSAQIPNNVLSFNLSPSRRLLSGTTTIYLVAQATFTVSTMTAYGFLTGRRVR